MSSTVHADAGFRMPSGKSTARRRNTNRQSRIIAAAAGVHRSLMGLLASIVAYLSVVAAIVVGFLLSADALLYHSRHLATDPRPQITAAVKADSLKTKKIAKPSRKAAELRAIPKKSTAAEYRRKAELSDTRREPHKRTAQETQRRYGLTYREHAPAPRVFGYAEEPRYGGDWRY
jgi:hypothetical protein